MVCTINGTGYKKGMVKNMRRRDVIVLGRRVAAGLLAVSLVLAGSVHTDAEKVTKEESVYADADASGEVSEITVKDILKNAGAGAVLSDTSDLKDIENTKGDETFSQDGTAVKWNAGKEDIQYQGTADKELPVGVEFTYTLDGKAVSPEELAGKSGKVTIHVTYHNDAKTVKTIQGKKETLYTPFLMVTGIVLPKDVFSAVKIDHGKVLEEGDSQVVVGYGLPGLVKSLALEDEDISEDLVEEFEITAQAKDFSLGKTITFATASLFSEMDTDREDGLDDLEKGIDKIADASDKLVRGSDKLSDATQKFQDIFGKYAQGEEALAKGIDGLDQGMGTFCKGINTYLKGSTALARGTKSYIAGTEKLTQGIKSAYQGAKALPAGYQQFSTGLQAYTNGVDALAKEENVKALNDGTKAVADGIGTVNAAVSEAKKTCSTYETLADNIEKEAVGMEDASGRKELEAYAKQLRETAQKQKAQIEAAETATAKEGALQKGADQVSSGVGQMTAGLQKLSQSSQSLRDADEQLSAGIQGLSDGLKKLNRGGSALKKAGTKIISGNKKLTKAGKAVSTGGSQLEQGVAKLKKGSSVFDQSTTKLADGIDQLAEGTDKYADGVSKFDQKGIRKMKNKYDKNFKGLTDRFEALVDLSRQYKNYSGLSKGMDGNVKFIIQTEKIEKK